MSTERNCPNCQHRLAPEDVYCSGCGQRYTTGLVSIWQLLRDFFSSVFNYDSRILQSFLALLIPGKLTNAYFEGKHRKYVHPARLFLFTAIVHFTLLGMMAGESLEEITTNWDNWKKEAHRREFVTDFNLLRNQAISTYPRDSMQIVPVLDTIREGLQRSGMAADSMFVMYYSPGSGIEKLGLATRDIIDMSTGDLVTKLNVPKGFARFQVEQVLRIMKKADNFISFMLGNLVWLVALMMPALALLLKLLYIRRRRYLVEHLIFSFHYHAFAFLLFSLFFAWQYFIDGSIVWLNLAFPGVLLYMFLAMRQVYHQGWLKTLLKFSIINFAYIFIFSVSLILTLIGGAALF
jgi:hypothetical protein